MMCDRATSLKHLDHKVSQFVKSIIDKGVKVFIVSDNRVMLGRVQAAGEGPSVSAGGALSLPLFHFLKPSIQHGS